MKSCVIGATQATIQGNGSVFIEAILDTDNSTDCEYGFCYGTDEGPVLQGNSIATKRNGDVIRALIPAGFKPSSRYYFRAWGTVLKGDFYGNEVALDSIVANPNGSGCPLRPNMLDFGDFIIAYLIVHKPETTDSITSVVAENKYNHATFNFGGTALKEGVYKTIEYGRPRAGEVAFDVYEDYPGTSPPHYVDVKAGNTVTVKRISNSVYEIVTCNAIYQSGGSNKLSTRILVQN